MIRFSNTLKNTKQLIGMVHVQALPGTPKYSGNNQAIIQSALNEAQMLKKAGFDAILIENMHDTPYLKQNVDHEISSILSIIAYEIKKQFELPTGIQILAGANTQALAAAHAANIDFIRVEGFVFGHMADEGFIESSAGDLLRYRKQIGADHIAIFTDIKKKHASHAITNDISIGETAEAAEFFLSDGLIVTGSSTGKTASENDLKTVNNYTQLPVIIGSGLSIKNIENYYSLAQGFIVGSSIKHKGKWFNDIDLPVATELVNKFKSLANR